LLSLAALSSSRVMDNDTADAEYVYPGSLSSETGVNWNIFDAVFFVAISAQLDI